MRTLVIAAALAIATPAFAEEGTVGAWNVEIERSALTGQAKLYAWLKSENTIPNVIGNPEPVQLHVRCAENGLESYIHWPGMVSVRPVQVSYRLDGGGIANETWNTSTRGTSTFMKRDTMRAFLFAQRAVVRASPPNDMPMEAVFNLGDIRGIYERANAACNGLPIDPLNQAATPAAPAEPVTPPASDVPKNKI